MRTTSNGGTRRLVRAMTLLAATFTLIAASSLSPASADPAPAPNLEPGLATPKDDPARGIVHAGLEPAGTPDCKGGLLVKGTTLCTHGPDAAPPGVDIKKSVAPAPAQDVTPKVVQCNGDGTSGLRTQVIYVRANNVTDRFNQFLASIRIWAEAADAIYNASAAETGGTRRIRFVHDANCNVTVANAVLGATGDDNFSNTITELQGLGFNRADRKYMLFVDANVYCGIGTILGDTQAGPDNINNGGPSYGRNDNGCWNGGTAAHEHMHNLGGVQLNAPNTSGGWHCTDEWDLMCYSDSPNFPPMRILCTDTAHDQRFDCNHNDYYSTNPPANAYLRTNWNAANSLYLTGGQRWGYVWANAPTVASYTPDGNYQRNSSGALNTITRSGVGTYTVRFPNIGVNSGTVNVTAYGSSGHMCKVGGWGASGADLTASVLCFTNTGVPADTTYTASFTSPTQNPGEIGFAWANDPTSASYTPSLSYQFNSTGATNTITRSAVGTYSVRMPGLGAAPAGHVKVTAYGGDSSACKVGGWSESAGARVISVFCHNAAGNPVDTLYTVTYVNRIGVLGVTGAASAYAWANDPTSASYTPSTTYQFNSTGGTNTITRSAVGTYTVRLPGLGQNKGHVQVTAYGGGAARCKVGGWGASGNDLLVTVNCHNPNGSSVDTTYAVSYLR